MTFKLSDFSEEDQIKIKKQAALPLVGTLESQLRKLVGHDRLTQTELKNFITNNPTWAVNDAILIATITKCLEWDRFLLEVKSGMNE